MGLVAPRLDVIKPSPGMAIGAQAMDMRAAGIDVISLGAGEPDFPTPPHIVEAAYEAMRKGETRYTAVDGTVALKRAVVGKFGRENGLDYQASEISVAGGGEQITYNALLATLAPGDEVVVPAPRRVSYTDIVRLGEGTPVVVPCPEADGFKLTPQALLSHARRRVPPLSGLLGPDRAPSAGRHADPQRRRWRALPGRSRVGCRRARLGLRSAVIFPHLRSGVDEPDRSGEAVAALR